MQSLARAAPGVWCVEVGEGEGEGEGLGRRRACISKRVGGGAVLTRRGQMVHAFDLDLRVAEVVVLDLVRG